MLTLPAPAKLNLALEVLRKRPDGYHEIRSVMQTVSLCDIFHFSPDRSVSFACDRAGWSADLSLVSRAVKLLQEATGCRPGARIDLEKQIPLLSGLGGDSSDAATVLRGLSSLWELELPQPELASLAARLGSDVPFFLSGGTALAAGRGDIITTVTPLPEAWFLIVVPETARLPGKTGRLYASLNSNHFTDGTYAEKLADKLREGTKPEDLNLFNTFENVAFDFFPGLRTYYDHLLKLGARNVHLSGTGPALFTIIGDEATAQDLYRRSRRQRLEAYLAETLGPVPRLDSPSCC